MIESSVYQDEKIQKTFELLEEGKTKEEIANHFGNKNWSSVDMYLRRRGFRWNGKTFVPKEQMEISQGEQAKFSNTKSAQIVRQLEQNYADIRQIATRHGFSTVDELGEYMKTNGYVWNNDLNNYEYDASVTPAPKVVTKERSAPSMQGMESYAELLSFLEAKKDRLYELLDTEHTGTLPRYKFKGGKANKTLGLPTSVQALLADFSQEFNVTQRDIIEISLAEFFKKYGYEEQLNSVLQS